MIPSGVEGIIDLSIQKTVAQEGQEGRKMFLQEPTTGKRELSTQFGARQMEYSICKQDSYDHTQDNL